MLVWMSTIWYDTTGPLATIQPSSRLRLVSVFLRPSCIVESGSMRNGIRPSTRRNSMKPIWSTVTICALVCLPLLTLLPTHQAD